MVHFPFDPIERAGKIEAIVTNGIQRKYYRFRKALYYYGGIATADALGCPFLCAYCWSYYKNLTPQRYGRFYWPDQVASTLLNIARKYNFKKVRITGAEPVLGKNSFDHFREVIKHIFAERPDIEFILETNGFILGYYPGFIEHLNFGNLFIRVAIKGWDEESFEKITGAKKEYFIYPLKAVKEMLAQGLSVGVAVMSDIFGKESRRKLQRRMREMNVKCEIEEEFLERYPHVMKNMEKRGITCLTH